MFTSIHEQVHNKINSQTNKGKKEVQENNCNIVTGLQDKITCFFLLRVTQNMIRRIDATFKQYDNFAIHRQITTLTENFKIEKAYIDKIY